MSGRWEKELTFHKDTLDVMPIPSPSWRPIIGIDTISAATVTGTNITIDSSSFTDYQVTPVVSGGAEGSTGTVSITITTTSGRTYNRSFKVKVGDL